MEDSTIQSTSDEPVAGRDLIRSAIAPPKDRIGAGRIWGLALTAGIAAGFISWAGGELAHNAFTPRLSPITLLSGDVVMLPTAPSTNTAEFKNATLAFAILGGVTGLVMGIAGGLAGRSLGRGVVVGLGGHLAGILIGTLVSLALLRFFYRGYVADPNDLLTPILIHGGIWMSIGAVGGSAFALGMGRVQRIPAAIAGAVLGAFFAPMLFQALSASFFPGAISTGPIASDPPVRLLALLSATVLIAAGAARGAQDYVTRSASPTSEPATSLHSS